MATETTVRVTCDRCNSIHYEGLQKDRPEYIRVTFWSSFNLNWEPEDLCEDCSTVFIDTVRKFPQT